MVASVIGAVLIAISGYLIQIAVFPGLGAVFVAPNMIIAVTIAFAVIYGAWPALAMGFFGGLMVDFMAGGAIGLSCFVPVVVGFLLAMLKQEINSGHVVWIMIFAGVASLINDFWNIVTMYFARLSIYASWGTLLRSILSAAETGIFSGIVFLIILRLIAFGEKRGGLPYLQRY